LFHGCLFVASAKHELAAESLNQRRNGTRMIGVAVSDYNLRGDYTNLLEKPGYSW
jgi:hypothetical protein